MRKLKTAKRPTLDSATSLSKEITPDPGYNNLWQDPFVHILLILATGFIVYFNSMAVPFMFDDFVYLANNPAIKSFSCFPETGNVMDFSMHADIKNNVILRPVAYFTFAVNYSLHGLDLFGYHLVNLLLHISSSILVYYFFSQLLLSTALSGSPENIRKNIPFGNIRYLPLFAALLFVCHPLQTQAVTYIIQRFVPLATFFYLAALVMYIQFRRSDTSTLRNATYIVSLIATILAMESKEIAFTLPMILLLLEIMFFRGNLAPRFAKLIPFFLTMAIIPTKVLHLPAPLSPDNGENISGAINLVNFGGISSTDYLMTQFGVITTYIRLIFFPVGQNFDYDWPLQHSFFKHEVLLPLALLLMIIGAGFYFLSRSKENHLYKIIAFGIFWFFITLSVESSIVPITDLIFEHRAYLPSIGLFMSLLAGVSVIFYRVTGKSIAGSKKATYLLIAIVVTLSAMSIARNIIWQDDVRFMADVVKKSPHKARAYLGLGEAMVRHITAESAKQDISDGKISLIVVNDKQINDVINVYKEAQRLEPNLPGAHVKLAEALMLQKNFDEAMHSLSTATELQPKNIIPYVLRGEIFEDREDFTSAQKEYLKAIAIEPTSYMPHIRLADLYARERNYQLAIKELEFVMHVYPEESTRQKLEKLRKL